MASRVLFGVSLGDLLPSEKGTSLQAFRALACKPRPGSGLDCLMCAIVARQQWGQPARSVGSCVRELFVRKLSNSPYDPTSELPGRPAVDPLP